MKWDIKFTKKDIKVIIILIAISPLVMLVFQMPSIGGALFFEGVMGIFLYLFAIWVVYYDLGKRGSQHALWGPNVFNKLKNYLPKMMIILGILGAIGFILAYSHTNFFQNSTIPL